MWWALLAGVLQQKMQEKAAQEQFQQQLRMQRVKELDPSFPTYGMQAQQFGDRQDAQQAQSYAQILGNFLAAPRNEPRQPGPSIGQDQGISSAFDDIEDRQRRQGMRGFNSMPGLNNW